MTSSRAWGRDTGRPDRQWRLTQDADAMHLVAADRTSTFAGEDLALLSTDRRWFRPAVVVDGPSPLRLTGLRRRELAEIDAALKLLVWRHEATPAILAARAWSDQANALAREAIAQGRWISREAVDRVAGAHPGHDAIATLRRAPEVGESLRPDVRRAVDFLDVDLPAWVTQHNETILANEVREHADFFDTVESRPLTPEQVRAVVSLDNRVHVIAAAGSGKTSVMVARAAYAIMRGFARPERVLLLAFNRDAALELRDRLTARLDALGLPSEGVEATTFHAFGLKVIGAATGRKPRVANWIENGTDVSMMCRIVDDLRDRSPQFAYRWDMFRLLYPRPSETPDGGEPDGYDRTTRTTGFRTARGEVVKSEGERIISDWLFFNGVNYVYEHPYDIDVADAEHSQYRPDFYYPDIDVWHEHWALDHHGRPPKDFAGYAESMEWKRNLHREHGTTLIETTWAEIIDSHGLEQLGRSLRNLTVELDWNPDRQAPGLEPLGHESLARLMRTFMTHVKSNSLTRAEVDRRLAARKSAATGPRARLFLDLYWHVHDAWQDQLNAHDAVDFEDMLVGAATHLEGGDVSLGHDLVMVDEFQDASHARARLTRALVQDEGKYLLAVGDDWQSINRFAGADLSVMTQFEEWFGDGPTLRLQTTFRSTQSITDAAGGFVTKNPRQLAKQVVSAHTDPGEGVRLVRVPTATGITQAIAGYLDELAGRLARGQQPGGRAGTRSVFVLGRYRFDRDLVPPGRWKGLDVTFRTTHGSKGLEADYVVIPNLGRGRYGFPSNIEDDPVLDLAMADPDPYPHAEERRLFYVALTRARREVALFVVAGQESPFVVELLEDGKLTVQAAEDDEPVRVCPRCGKGTQVIKSGAYGKFYGCSRFPRCTHTEKLGSGAAPHVPF